MNNKENPVSVPIQRLAVDATAKEESSSILLPNGAKVNFISYENPAQQTSYYFCSVTQKGKTTEVTATLKSDGNRMHVKDAQGHEHHFDAYHSKGSIAEDMANAMKAMKKGNYTEEEAIALQKAQEMVVGSLVNSKLGMSLDPLKTDKIVDAYKKVANEGKKGR